MMEKEFVLVHEAMGRIFMDGDKGWKGSGQV